jgi:hypothetical protein
MSDEIIYKEVVVAYYPLVCVWRLKNNTKVVPS